MRRLTPEFNELERRLEGKLVARASSNFSAQRDALTWNACKPTRSPDAIVTIASVDDVRRSLRFAREYGLKVSVRSSGHNYFGAHVRNGGLLLDLGMLNKIQIDADRRRARVQPGVASGQLVSALTPLKLGFPVGHAGNVGLGGFLLNGGLGWNMGRWGPACASVRGVEIVLADGELVYASDEHYQDLFWAVRGAGPGFFGAITAYDLALHPLPTSIAVQSLAFDVTTIDLATPWLDKLIADSPPGIEIAITLGMPQEKFLPSKSNVLSITATAFVETAETRHWLSALDDAPLHANPIGYKRYDQLSMEALMQESADRQPRMAGDVFWSNASVATLLSALRSTTETLPSNHSYVLIQPIKPLDMDVDGAFSVLGSKYVAAYSFWDDAAHDEQCRTWIAKIRNAIEPLKTGHYVGEADLAVEKNRLRQCFTASAFEKLIATKRQYDPEGIFFWYLQ